VEASDEVVESACAHISAGLRHHYVRSAELIEAETLMKCSPFTQTLCRGRTNYIQARRHEAPANRVRPARTRLALLQLRGIVTLKVVTAGNNSRSAFAAQPPAPGTNLNDFE